MSETPHTHGHSHGDVSHEHTHVEGNLLTDGYGRGIDGDQRAHTEQRHRHSDRP